jgi:hypothetical protein
MYSVAVTGEGRVWADALPAATALKEPAGIMEKKE